MPIKIAKTYDPLTPQSYQYPGAPWIGINPDDPNDVAPPIARLERLIQQYVNREISSCSVLIGGDRGSGKTSLVSKVIERLRRRDGDINETTRRHEYWRFPRPLLVRVHGPQCMPNNRLSGGGEDNSREQSKLVLQEIAESLHRAVVDELGRVFAGRAEHGTEAEREQAAQFRLELDEGPGHERLREMWTLFAGLNGVEAKFPSDPHKTDLPQDQAWRELTAVASSIQLVREIRQHKEQEAQNRDKSEAARSRTREDREEERKHRHEIGFWKEFLRQMLDGGRLINPLGGLMVSAIVFFSFMKADINIPIAALVGLVSGLAATVLLNFATAKKYANALLSDAGLAAIDRTLPIVIRRLEYAGIFPVIVVDELDKLDDEHGALQTKMEDLVKHLKTFCSELSFVCFIVGRPYYNWVQERTGGAVGDRHAVDTFFSNRILVSYEPDWLKKYLNRLLQEPDPTLAAECEFLRSLYLYRAKGHLADLSAFVAADHKLDGTADVHEGLTKVPQYVRQVRYQIAVSAVLEHPETRQLLRQAPDHLEPLIRTLYAPARLWERDEPSFAIDDICSRNSLFRPMLLRLLRSLGQPAPSRDSILLFPPPLEGTRYRWKYRYSRDSEFAVVPRSASDTDVAKLTMLSRVLGEISNGRLGLHDLTGSNLHGDGARLINYSFPVARGWFGILQIQDVQERLLETAHLADAVEGAAQELRALLLVAALERSTASPWIGLTELEAAQTRIVAFQVADRSFLEAAGERHNELMMAIRRRGELTRELETLYVGAATRVDAVDIASWSAELVRIFRRTRRWPEPRPTAEAARTPESDPADPPA